MKPPNQCHVTQFLFSDKRPCTQYQLFGHVQQRIDRQIDFVGSQQYKKISKDTGVGKDQFGVLIMINQ